MSLPIFPPNGGTLSVYLIGTWAVNKQFETTIYLANPTSISQEFLAVFFDNAGNPLHCENGDIPHNGLKKLTTNQYEKGEGTVKILSFGEEGYRDNKPQPGLVGYQRKTWHFSNGLNSWIRNSWNSETESPLFQIPFEVLDDKEMDYILKACPR